MLVVFVGFCLWFVSVFLINPGYFDRMYASFYNKYSKSCDVCEAVDHGGAYCPQKAVENGAIGRWTIPSVGVNVACYEAAVDPQEVTDARDSAALLKRTGVTLLADHNYQGFDVIKKCEVGTVAYMNTGTDKQKYICAAVFEGYNIGTDLIDLNGNVVEFENGLTNYTCNFFKDTITIAQFVPVES